MKMKTNGFTGRNSLRSQHGTRQRERQQRDREWARERRRRAHREKRENRRPGVKTVWCVLVGCSHVLLRTGSYGESLYVGCHRCKSPNPFQNVTL